MGDNRHTIYHPNLFQSPGNVLIEFSGGESLGISKFLDWDGAVSHPLFYGCEKPVQMGNWGYKYDEYGKMRDEMRATPERQQIKQVFRRAVRPRYLHQARAPGDELARQSGPWAVSGPSRHIDIDRMVHSLLDLGAILDSPGVKQIAPIEKASKANQTSRYLEDCQQ